MAATTAIIASVGEVGYQAYQGYQANKAAKKAQATALATRPDPVAGVLVANQSALQAQARQRTKAGSSQGVGSTMLTGGQGAQSPPPATKTLLGL